MTDYGTIPSSSQPQPPPAVNLGFVSRAKQRIKARLHQLRSWRQMLDYHHMNLPKSVREFLSRVRTNLGYFQTNDAVVELGVFFLSLIYRPTSLIVLVVMVALWLFLYFLRDEPLVVFGKVIGDPVVFAALSVLTIVALFLTGATWNIVAAILIGGSVVLGHACVRETDDLNPDEEEDDVAAVDS